MKPTCLSVGLSSLALLIGLSTAFAQDAPRDPKAFDKLVVDTLRDVHNKGADLYNTSRDYTGAYRIYEGALRTVRPFLSHRSDAQKLIDDGFANFDKEADPARRAFLLHETIEKVRALLKTGNATPPVPTPMPKVETKPAPKVEPPPPVKVEPKPTPTPKVEPPPPVKVEPKLAPTPKVEPKPKVKPKTEVPAKSSATTAGSDPVAVPPKGKPAATGVSGKVTLAGKAAGIVDVLLVSLDLPKPRVFSATTASDSSYTLSESVPPGKYVVIVTGKNIPDKYSTTTTSGIVVEVKGNTVGEITLK